MPQAFGGTLVSDTAQINPGVIVDSDINAAAAIADTKLAQITTASKVSGAALTSLASIPAGAGVIPAANIPPGLIFKNGVTSKNSADASTTQNIAHGLGATPKYVRIRAYAVNANNSAPLIAETVYNGTTQSSQSFIVIAGPTFSIVQTFSLNNLGTATSQDGVVTWDGTNIIITWTKNGSPTGTYQILWEAYT